MGVGSRALGRAGLLPLHHPKLLVPWFCRWQPSAGHLRDAAEGSPVFLLVVHAGGGWLYWSYHMLHDHQHTFAEGCLLHTHILAALCSRKSGVTYNLQDRDSSPKNLLVSYHSIKSCQIKYRMIS